MCLFGYVFCVYLYAHTRTLNYVAREYIYIRRGLRVVVLLLRAMREPQCVERQQSDSTLFLYAYVIDNKLTYNQTIKQINRMKKVLFVAMALLVACSASFAQNAKEIMKERQATAKLAKKELGAKVDKTTKKEAKRLKKEGWVVSPGALPLEKQLERSYLMEFEYDENLFPKYIMANAQSIGENYDAAKTAATSLAITNLAGQIQTEVTALIENTVANQQLAAEDAASISETVMASKNLISQSIGRVITVVECYRVLDNKNREVMVRIAYNGEMAKEAAKKAIRQELEKKGEKLHEQLDQVLGF